MTISRARGGSLLLVLVLLAGACVQREEVLTSRQVIGAGTVGESAVRSGRNLPSAFEVVVAPRVGGECPPQLRDPALQTLLTLENSVLQPVTDSLGTHYRAVGNYSVQPRGRYGDEQPGDGLRVDCTRLRALGVIRLETAGAP